MVADKTFKDFVTEIENVISMCNGYNIENKCDHDCDHCWAHELYQVVQKYKRAKI